MPIGSVFGAFFSVYITLYCLNCGIIMNVYAVMTVFVNKKVLQKGSKKVSTFNTQ